MKKEIAVINHPRIKNKPPSGVMNQICLASMTPVEIIKIEPEKNRIPVKKNPEIRSLDFSDKGLALLIKSKANT